MENKTLALFDGHAIVHRAFHAFNAGRPQSLTVPGTGEVVTAVFGFAQILLNVIGNLKPACCAVAFDTPRPTFRHEMYEQYKANRPPAPDELVNQFGRVKQLVEALQIPIYEIDGFEADDVLGTLAAQAAEQGLEAVIVTGDADAMQLVSPHVNLLYPKSGGSFSNPVRYDEEAVKEKYGFEPLHVIDFKGLAGDTSDNIPGVRGIGPKTATTLIQKFGTVEDIYAHIDEVEPTRIQNLLRDNEAIARTSKELATINTHAPVTLNVADCRLNDYDHNKAAGLLRELHFNSLLEKLPDYLGVPSPGPVDIAVSPPRARDYHTVSTEEDMEEMLARLSPAEWLAFDTETDSLTALEAPLVGISLSAKPGEAYYIPVGHVRLDAAGQLPLDYVIEHVKPLLENPATVKIAHNGKYDITVLASYGITVANFKFDTMIAGYLLSENALGLKNMAFSRLGIEMKPITDLIGTGAKKITMSQVEIDSVSDYSCADADLTGELAALLEPELKDQGLWQLFADVEMPLVPVLIEMEKNGIALDTGLLGEMSREFGEQIRGLEEEIYKLAGRQFNINSPTQLGPVLFEEMGLQGGVKRKGKYSTAAGILEGLRGEPVIDHILEYRQLSKLKSTYIDAMPAMINRRTGRLHTSFNQTRTTTGRLSSSDPNLQNIPVRGELGRQVRQAFIAPAGCQLLSADYSQIDLRALAHLSQDPALVEAFRNGEDIHSATASRIYNVPVNEVTSDMRRLAKTVNFGVIYGMSDYGLEQATELSREEARAFITSYFEKYPGIQKFMESIKEEARKTGFVQTLLGRRRAIPEINSSNRMVREGAERMAINMPVQGTSADIIKVAMVNLYRLMNEKKLKSLMLLQVHDELLFEVPQDELEEMSRLVPETMSNAVELIVPVKVDVHSGSNWDELK